MFSCPSKRNFSDNKRKIRKETLLKEIIKYYCVSLKQSVTRWIGRDTKEIIKKKAINREELYNEGREYANIIPAYTQKFSFVRYAIQDIKLLHLYNQPIYTTH